MKVSTWRATGLGLGLAALASIAHAQAPAQWDAGRQFAQVPRNPLGDNPLGQPAGPNVQVGTLEVRDITLNAPTGASVSFGRIAFSGFKRDGESVRADRAVFEKIAAKLGGDNVEIPSLTMTNLVMPSELFRAFSEGGSLDRDWAGLLTRATIAEVKADTILTNDPAAKETTRFNGMVLTNLRDGILESAQLAGLTGTNASTDTSQNAKISLGAVRYQAVNFSEFVRFARGGGSGDAKTLLGSAMAEKLEIVSPDATVRMAKFEMTGIQGRAPQQGFPMKSAAASALGGDQPASDPKLAARYAQEVLRYLRIGRYAIEGLEVVSPDGNFKMQELSLSGWSGKGFERFQVRGVDLQSPAAPGKLGSFEIERVSYGRLLDLALDAAANGREPDFSPGTIVDLVPRIGAIRLAGLDLNTPVGPFSLGDFRIEMDDRADRVPEKILIGFNA
jgi:hypothetical protein